MSTPRPSNPLHCDFCGADLPDAAALAQHVRDVHAGRPFAPRCEICGATFESPADLKAHHEAIHRSGRA